MRACPSCGAGNPPRAPWCGQCYAPLGEAAAVPRSAPPLATPAPAAPPPPSAPGGLLLPPPPGTPHTPTADEPDRPDRPDRADQTDQLGTGGRSATTDGTEELPGGFRRRDGVLEWRCAVCEHHNPVEATACAVCGAAFGSPPPRRGPAVDPQQAEKALAATLMWPGAGHLVLGRTASGATRALLFGVWFIGALLVLGSAGLGGLGLATPLLLGAAAVYAGSALDVRSAPTGAAEVLTGRRLSWLVAGVTGLLIVVAMAGAMRIGQA